MLKILTELLKAIVRIEKKVDSVLIRQDQSSWPHQPLNYGGQVCPLCKHKVDYIPINIPESAETLYYRKCGCVPKQTRLLNIGEK